MTEMTKDELRKYLQKGKTLNELFDLSVGQCGCTIYKDRFDDTDDIIYIPDMEFNEINPDESLKNDKVGIEWVISQTYTGNDFIKICEGYRTAKRIFSICDWQHPEAALYEDGLEVEE